LRHNQPSSKHQQAPQRKGRRMSLRPSIGEQEQQGGKS
jgi:hypothetical protein